MRTICRMRYLMMAVLLGCSLEIFAQNRQGQIFYSKDDGLYWAAIETTYFIPYVAQQRSTNWCWAACTQMVLNYQGVNVTQEQIVQRVFGVCIDRPGNAMDIVQGARGWNVDGHTINARYDYSFVPQRIVDDLVNKYPLVVGLTMPGQNIGHAFVMTGMSFEKEGDAVYPQSVILRDPWPGNQSRIVISWSEFTNRANTIVHIFPD